MDETQEVWQDVMDSRPPQSPGFWTAYGKHKQPEGFLPLPPPQMCSPEMTDPLQPFCCQPPKVRTVPTALTV